MHGLTARSFLASLAIVAAAACADRTPGADSASDSTPVTPSTPAPPEAASGSSAPVAGRPACARPVAVTYYARGGVPDEFIVTFGAMNGANADTLTNRLAQRHGFTPTHRYDGAFSGFSARIPLAALEAVRCEPAVTRISQVVIGGIGTVPPPGPGG